MVLFPRKRYEMVRVTQSRLEPSDHEKGLFSYLLNAVSLIF